MKSRKIDDTTLRSLLEVLKEVPSGFSLVTFSFDILGILKILSTEGCVDTVSVSDLVDLLVTKFESSFRPLPKDVLAILVSNLYKMDHLSAYLRLLWYSLHNHQQGNPKNVFVVVASEFMPWLVQLPQSLLELHRKAIQPIIGLLFDSSANMQCMIAYLKSTGEDRPVDVSASTGKRKRSSTTGQFGDTYAASLFDSISPSCTSSVLFELILTEFVSRDHSLRDNALDLCVEESYLLFTRLSVCTENLSIRMNLWRLFSDLRMYQLRGEQSEKQVAALRVFADSGDKSQPIEIRLAVLRTVMEIDPVNFTDYGTERVLGELKTAGSTATSPNLFESTLTTLFKVYASKGLLHRLVERLVNERVDLGLPGMSTVVTRIVSSLSSHDLVAVVGICVGFIRKELISCGVPDGSAGCAPAVLGYLELLSSLLDQASPRLSDNVLDSTAAMLIDLVDQSLVVAIEKNILRPAVSRLVIVVSDVIGRIFFSRQLPYGGSGSLIGQSLETALRLVARKEASARCGALIRLATQFDTDGSGIWKCFNREKTVNEFCATSELNKHALMLAVSEDLLLEESALTENVSCSQQEQVPLFDELLEQTQKVVFQFGAAAFSPASLRKVKEFPREIVQLESGWDLLCHGEAAKKIIQLIQTEWMRDQKNGTKIAALLYSLSVVVESARRRFNKPRLHLPVEELRLLVQPELVHYLSKEISSLSLVFGRFLVSLNNVLVADQALLDLLIFFAHQLLHQGNKPRDRPSLGMAYYCLSESLVSGRDKRRVRLPWWTNKMSPILVCMRGFVGSAISGDSEATKVCGAQFTARLWKIIVDQFSAQNGYKIAKSVLVLLGDYLKLAEKVTNAEALDALNRGAAAVLIPRLSASEKQHLHALLARDEERDLLKRIIEEYEKNFKFAGKV